MMVNEMKISALLVIVLAALVVATSAISMERINNPDQAPVEINKCLDKMKNYAHNYYRVPDEVIKMVDSFTDWDFILEDLYKSRSRIDYSKFTEPVPIRDCVYAIDTLNNMPSWIGCDKVAHKHGLMNELVAKDETFRALVKVVISCSSPQLLNQISKEIGGGKAVE